MKKILITLLLLTPVFVFAQGLMLKSGDPFPDISINQIINATVKSFSIKENKDKKHKSREYKT